MEHVLFLVFVLIQSQVSAKIYEKSTSACRFKNNIYKSVKVRSEIYCSALCIQEFCSRFIYDNSTNMCELHSDTIMLTSATETPPGKSLYLSTHKDCNITGYDFVESQNLCIKWYGGLYNWWEGRALCQQDGGDLVTLDKIDKWNFIYQHLDSCLMTRAWLGLIDKTWINGVPFQDVYGVTTLVDSTIHEQSCVRLKLGANKYILQDNDCSTVQHTALCEIPLY